MDATEPTMFNEVHVTSATKTTVEPMTAAVTLRSMREAHASGMWSHCVASTRVRPLQISIVDCPSHEPSHAGPLMYTYLYAYLMGSVLFEIIF